MSYDPSYRMPPRQERWPHATPAEGWPSYRDGDEADRRYAADRRDAHAAGAGQGQAGRHAAVATAPFPPAGDGYGRATDNHGYDSGGYGVTRTAGYQTGGYGGAFDGYATPDAAGYATGTDDGFDGFTRTEAGYGPAAATAYAPGYDWAEPGRAAGPDDFAGSYLGPGSYIEPGLSGDPRLTAPDAGVRPDTWLADLEDRRQASRRGPVVGAVTEILATSVVIGVSTLAAGLLKTRTSPVSAMGTVFIDRTPVALRNLALHHFGAQGRTVLLLGMYAAFAVVAIVIGVLARRAPAAGVAGIAAFTLFAEFVVITRPGGQVSDIAPAIIGGMAGVVALLWLYHASAPPLSTLSGLGGRGRGGSRRRTR
jgi:hypothetical protein